MLINPYLYSNCLGYSLQTDNRTLGNIGGPLLTGIWGKFDEAVQTVGAPNPRLNVLMELVGTRRSLGMVALTCQLVPVRFRERKTCCHSSRF